MSSTRILTLLGAALIVGLVSPAIAQDHGSERRVRARLAGANEVPTVSSTGHGELRGMIDRDDTELTYELSFDDLEGTVLQSHIHIGQTSVSGGIMIWLCGTATNPGPPGTPTCPPPGGSVGRTVTAADVLAVTAQGIAAGEFAEALQAIRRGLAYANVHSTKHPSGEIRGQINESKD